MKKYFPYIVAIFIPIMTFVIFFVMARNRSFIFSSSFSDEVKAEFNGVYTKLNDQISKNIYSTLIDLSNKTEVKGAFFTQNVEGSSEVLRRVTNTINAYAIGSDFIKKILIVNNDREIIVNSGRTETGRRKVNESLWSKLKDSDINNLKHILYNGRYIYSISVNGQGKVILFVDVERFSIVAPKNKNWLRKNLKYSNNAVFFACKTEELKENLKLLIKKNQSNFKSPVMSRISGYVIWGKRQFISLRNGRKINTDILVFVVGDPKNFPLNFLQKLLLIINGSIVLALLILLTLKLKNEKEKDKIRDYKERTDFVFGMLEESSKILDESAKLGELSLNELDDVAEGLEERKGELKAKGVAGESKAKETNSQIVSVEVDSSEVEENGTVEVPDEAYEKKPIENIDEELQSLASEVSKGANINDPNLKNYWSKITNVLDIDFHISRFALLEKNEDGLFTVARSSGLSPETIENLKFSEFDKFYDKFFKLNKNLYIIKDAFVNKTLSEMFSPEDKKNIGELLLFPVSKSADIIAILCFARERGLNKLEEQDLKSKIVHESHL